MQKIVSKFSSLINPGFQISSFISSLTGITNDMLENAPAAKTVLDDFLNFIGDDILIAHNAHFDINFIYDSALNTKFIEKYISFIRRESTRSDISRMKMVAVFSRRNQIGNWIVIR